MINERIKDLRKELGLNQAEFGQKLGVTRSVILNIEKGKNKFPPADIFIEHICEIFNVNKDWLVDGNGDIFDPGAQPNKMFNEFWDLFRDLKPEYQNYVRQQIDNLLEIQNKDKNT